VQWITLGPHSGVPGYHPAGVLSGTRKLVIKTGHGCFRPHMRNSEESICALCLSAVAQHTRLSQNKFQKELHEVLTCLLMLRMLTQNCRVCKLFLFILCRSLRYPYNKSHCRHLSNEISLYTNYTHKTSTSPKICHMSDRFQYLN